MKSLEGDLRRVMQPNTAENLRVGTDNPRPNNQRKLWPAAADVQTWDRMVLRNLTPCDLQR